MKRPTTIDEVLAELDKIVEVAVAENNTAAIFAYVYRRTTAAIKQGIEEGIFEDNERMHQFDVLFANLYIEAWHGYRNQKVISESWRIAFEAEKENLIILQHLILGMNAHINLDLGHAAAQIMKDKQLEDLKSDFMKVNQILFSLTDELQQGLGKVSPLLFLADWLGKRNDEQLINFGIDKARRFSWVTAERIWQEKENDSKMEVVHSVDQTVAQLGQLMRHPKGWVLKFVLRVIAWFEEREIRKIIVGFKGMI